MLTDTRGRPLHDLRISVMDRCNFRCPYCMPHDTFHERYRFLKAGQRLSFPEIARLARLFASLGVRKLRLTGGEPLLRADLQELVAELSSIEGVDEVALTTNGILLAKQAAGLKAHGLSRVTVSLDSLDDDTFKRMSGGFGGKQDVLDGIRAAQEAGFSPVKINAVIERGVNENTALGLVEHFRGQEVIVRFIEYMDVGNRNHWSMDRVAPSRELMERIHARWPLRAAQAKYHGEVAERYVFEDGAGEVGFISSITAPFCGSCSRARLSSDGMFYTCLFSTQGHDLKTLLRAGASDAQLLAHIRTIWSARSDRYSELRAQLHEQTLRRVEMHYIGG